MPDSERPLLAVLIDADNVPARFAEAIFEEIASFGEASVRRIYGDFSGGAPQGWNKERLASLAIVPHQQFANTTGKNASDIALVIDAMDILHSGRFDGFVLVSSDSDFTRLASRVREQGLDVFGMGQKKTPEAFRKACKRFIFLENLDAVPAPARGGKAPKSQQKATAAAIDEANPAPGDAALLVERAMDAIDQDEEWYSLGQIGQYIVSANPDFDTRTYGKRKLSDLIAELDGFEMKRGQGNQRIVRKLQAP